ncbi:MAG: MATE family efflux transporter [Faecousia sp.]
MRQPEKENKMGHMPVGRLLATMALPMTLSMLVQALYNIVDSVYVSRVSEDALTAVSLAFPVQNLMIGFSTGVGVGVNSLLSKCLGSREFDRANRAAGNGVLLAMVCCLTFTILGGCFSGFFFRTRAMWLPSPRAAPSTSPSAPCSASAFSERFSLSACFRPRAGPFTP